MTIGPSASVTKSAQSAVAYLQTQGWTKAQATGIVANLQGESGVNLTPNLVGDGGKAFGIAQWHPDRQAIFQQVYGKPIQTASTQEQLAFVNWELNNTEAAAGVKIRATNNAADAARVTDQYYERSSGTTTGQRVQYANALNGDTGPATPPDGLTTQESANINGRNKPAGTGTPQAPTTEYVTDPVTGEKYRAASNASSGGVLSGMPFNGNPDAVDVSQPLRNVLHDYPSYTYGLSLHLLTADEYNGLTTGSIINYAPVRVLIASAGRYNSSTSGVIPSGGAGGVFNRSPYFSDDFYFEDFTMTTVIGTNAVSRNTNAIEMKFTIIEPYGMTLINRLLDQANDPDMNCDNYLDMVYLIQIDFFASDDVGEIVGVVPGITKRFPVKITQMDIAAGVKGSTYTISAVPYNHSAFEQSTVSTPANFEVASGSINEMFVTGGPANKSYADALNGWQNDLSNNNKIGVPDTYNFNIHPSIAQSSLNPEGALSSRDSSMVDLSNTASIRQSNLGAATKDFNPAQRTMAINAGTSIDKVLDYSIRNSDYIQKQMAIPDGVDPQAYLQQKAANANQPLNWYKITPQVTLGQFDPVRKVQSRNITYNVNPYTIYNVKNDAAPQGKATNVVKEYNYIYTGQNDDVLNFDINFNTLYYTAQTAYRSALSSIYKTPDTASQSSANQNSQVYQGSNQKSNSVMPMMMKPQVYNAKARATGGSVTAKSVAVADLEDSLMTLSSADMLNVQLTIVGDPQFIKQDDCFYNPAQSVSPDDPRLTPNGSLRTDYGEIYVSLMFRTPVDIDEDTGMMKFNSKYRTSLFSGLYKILTVQSEFKTGQFTQVLNLIRLPYQASYDYSSQSQSSSTQRNSDITADNASILGKNNPIKNVGTPNGTPTVPESDPQQQAAQNLLQPGYTNRQQQNLAGVNNTASTVPITGSNQPQAIIPGP